MPCLDGNRLSTQAGGDASGGNLRYADYDVNRLNQYERRTVPAAIDVIGAAPAGSTVTVNTQSVERRGAYYRQELSIPNSSTSVWQTVDVDVAPLGSVDKSGKVFVPKSPEMFAQDADGNLTQDGRWNYTWDAENRLIKQASRTDAPSGSEKCLVFEYDYRSRRIGKKVWNNTAGTGTAALDERYLYDGWNLAAVINSSSALTKFFVWGLDLSGTMQGAGGVDGLLWGRMNGLAPRFAAYDGNGNVSALVNGSSGSVDAQYEYGPFGELVRATGTMAKNNPFRFSTKYQDDETDQLYYGYRFYNPTTGRWLSRDLIGELGGANLLYAIAGNDLVNGIDVLGLVDFEFVVIKNETGKNRENHSGDWGSPGSFFSGSESVTPPKSATTTITGHGPISGHCCNTVISKKEPSNEERSKGNAGAIIVYMKDADPGTYSVQLSFSGSASITIGPAEDQEGHAAWAALNFYAMEKLVLHGSVSIGRSGKGKMSWSDSKNAPVFVTIKGRSDRVQIGKYDLTMNLNKCGDVTVTATGTVGVGGYKRVK